MPIRLSLQRAVAALLLAFAVAGCGGGGGRAPCPAGLRCLEAGNAAEPQTLDPDKSQDVWEANIQYDLFVGLTQWNAHGEVVPGMATSWDISPDGLTWTFHLRDAQWSDGVPVTAGDFVYGLQRLENPATASVYAYLLYLISNAREINEGKAAPETIGARELDPHTLQLTLTHPAPYLPLLLVHQSAMPIPAHVVTRWGNAWMDPAHIVSNGPYILKAWLLGQRVILARNPRFWENSATCFDQISYYPTSDLVTAERRVESGEFDLGYTFTSARVRYLRKRMPAYVHAVPYLANWYLSMNQRNPKLRDRRVRLALSLGIDREFIARKLTQAGSQPLYGFTPPGMAAYRPPTPPIWSNWPFVQRQAAARALLRQAGYGPGHPLQLDFKYGQSDKVQTAAMQADWRAIGLDITLSPEERKSFTPISTRAISRSPGTAGRWITTIR